MPVNSVKPVAKNAERFLAVNPLLPQPHRFLGTASEALGDSKRAIRSYETLLKLDPRDPADVHFRLAKLLHQAGDPGARRHVLEALEEAPRYREAHRLLLAIRAEAAAPAVRAEPAGDPPVEPRPQATP